VKGSEPYAVLLPFFLYRITLNTTYRYLLFLLLLLLLLLLFLLLLLISLLSFSSPSYFSFLFA